MKTPAPNTTHSKAALPRIPHSPHVKIKINTDLIYTSKQADSSHCMIAEALKLALPEAKSISVDLQTIRFSLPEKRLRFVYLTPRIAQIALVEFDQGIEPEPFEFNLSRGHVTAMYKRPEILLSGVRTDSVSGVENPVIIKVKKPENKTIAKMNLAKQGIRKPESKGEVPQRVGGKTPPTTPFARRRAFGLRALQK